MINTKFKKNKLYFLAVNIFLVLYLIFLTAPIPGNAVQGDLIWARSMGGAGDEQGNDIIVDSSNNAYTVGTFTGTVDFDPGAGVENKTSTGSSDIFISKLDANGIFSWVKQIGSTGDDYAFSVDLDSTGNIYVVGYFTGTVDFDPGAGVSDLVSNGNNDIFILKLDSNGDFVYAQNFGSVSQDRGVGLSVDSFDNVIVAGTFQNTVDFDFDVVDTYDLISNGNTDIFVLKLDPTGDFIQAQSFGGTGFDSLEELALDSNNNIYTTGAFQSTVDFDPDLVDVSNLTSAGSEDIFISKLSPAGDFLYAHRIGGGSGESGKSIAIDQSNNIFITSNFSGTIDFDPDLVDVFNLTSFGSTDAVVFKLDASGDFLWAKQLGGASSELGETLSVDSSNNVYVTGYMDGLGDFDPGIGVFNLDVLDNQYTFILKLNNSGDFIWAKQVGGSFFDQVQNTTLDSQNNLYLTGSFNDTGDFDTGDDIFNLTSLGSSDILVLKLGDASGPVLSEVTPIGVVVNNFTPTYTFNTTEAGTISYQGSCSSPTTIATLGNNTITLNTLSAGYYENCFISVSDNLNNQSTPLQLTPFSIVIHSGGSGTPPVDPFPDPDPTSGPSDPQPNEPEIILEPVVESVPTPTVPDLPPIVLCNSGDIYSTLTGELCNAFIPIVPEIINPFVPPIVINNPVTPTPIPPKENPIIIEEDEIEPVDPVVVPTPIFEVIPTPVIENPNIEPIPDFPIIPTTPPYEEYEPVNIISYLNKQAQLSFNEAKEIFSSYVKDLREILNKKEVDIFVKILGALGLVSGLLVSLASTIFASPISFAELPLIPFRIWSLLLTVLGIKKRTRRWGVVYDSQTKQPLDPAYVSLKNLEGETVSTAITDIDGRYGFVVEPGTYALLVNKTNYIFPSAKLAGKHGDELYDNIYWGDYFNISTPGEVITRNIPLDPLNFSWNEFEKEKRNLTSSFKRKDLLISKMANVFFNIGFVLACIAFIVTPQPYNGIIFASYLFVLIIRKIGIKTKNKGNVIEKLTGMPLSYGIVRVFYTDIGQEIAHSVIDKYGNFYCLVKNGTYTVKIEKKNIDDSYTTIYQQSLVTVKDGVLNMKFIV